MAALGLWVLLWTTVATGGGHVSGTVAQLARQVGVDPRTLRRLLALLDRAGLLVPARGGWQVPNPVRLEGVAGARGTAGFERDPRGAFRVVADRVAASLTAGGRRGGLPVLTALGAYTVLRLRHAPWRGDDRPRPVTVGGRRRPAPGVQVAAVLGLHRATWARLGAALVDGGLFDLAGRGYQLAVLTDLHAAPGSPSTAAAAPRAEGVQAHPTDSPGGPDLHLTDSPGGPDLHLTDSSERAHKSLREDPSQKDPASAGRADVAAAPDWPARPPRAGRHGDPKQDADDNHDRIKSSLKGSPAEHPDLAQTVAEIIKTQPAFSAIGRPGHPARTVLDRALYDGVDLYALIDMCVNGGYAWGSRWPAAVLAQKLPAAIAKGRHLDRQRAAQARHGSGRPVAVALAHDVSDECAHGHRSCATCPACKSGQPDNLTGQPCRCHTPASAPQQPATAPQPHTAVATSDDPAGWFRCPPQPQTPPLCAHGTADCTTCWQCSGGLPDRPLGRLCTRCRYGQPREAAA